MTMSKQDEKEKIGAYLTMTLIGVLVVILIIETIKRWI
jgi:hypothetical protein